MDALTIYEKHPDTDAYRVGGFYSPYCLVATEKRFSDAELVAEYWSATLDFLQCYDTGDHDETSKAREMLVSFARFATHEHFDEDPS